MQRIACLGRLPAFLNTPSGKERLLLDDEPLTPQGQETSMPSSGVAAAPASKLIQG
jgi:hypothetical protein